MARPPQKPVFLALKSYRQRRLRDVARVLPLLGIILWLLPLLWRGDAGKTGGTLIYIFVIWSVLVILSAVVATRIKVDKSAHDTPHLDRD